MCRWSLHSTSLEHRLSPESTNVREALLLLPVLRRPATRWCGASSSLSGPPPPAEAAGLLGCPGGWSSAATCFRCRFASPPPLLRASGGADDALAVASAMSSLSLRNLRWGLGLGLRLRLRLRLRLWLGWAGVPPAVCCCGSGRCLSFASCCSCCFCCCSCRRRAAARGAAKGALQLILGSKPASCRGAAAPSRFGTASAAAGGLCFSEAPSPVAPSGGLPSPPALLGVCGFFSWLSDGAGRTSSSTICRS